MAQITLSNDSDDALLTQVRTRMSDGTSIPSAAEAVRKALEWASERMCPECGYVQQFRGCPCKDPDRA